MEVALQWCQGCSPAPSNRWLKVPWWLQSPTGFKSYPPVALVQVSHRGQLFRYAVLVVVERFSKLRLVPDPKHLRKNKADNNVPLPRDTIFPEFHLDPKTSVSESFIGLLGTRLAAGGI